jgi:hypothetical protein
MWQHPRAVPANKVQAIDDAGVVEAYAGGVADQLRNVAGEPALWRVAHKNNCGAKTYI